MNDLMQNVYERITVSTGSRSVVYRHMNPNYIIYGIYKERHWVNDRFRMAFTRFRVSIHNLCIETGRWNKRESATKRGASLCVYSYVERFRQSEWHGENCPVTNGIRQNVGLTRVVELFTEKYTYDVVCEIMHDVLKSYQ